MYIEETIVKAIKKASKLWVGLSRKQIMSRTNVLCQCMKVVGSYKNFTAGKDWFDGLIRRFPDVVLRKPKKLSSVRARMLNPGVVDNYFKDLGKLITDFGLQDHPERIWNCDETGFNFEHAPGKVVAETGARCMLSRTSSKSSNVTLMACINGAGTAMPPMIITKGKTSRSLATMSMKLHLIAYGPFKRMGGQMTRSGKIGS
jgi:hypothetical protein